MRRAIAAVLLMCLMCFFSLCFAEDESLDSDDRAVTVTQDNGEYASQQTFISEKPVLTDIEYAQQGDRSLIIKTYETPVKYDVQKLTESDFQDGNLIYTHKGKIKVKENRTVDTKQASQIVTIDHVDEYGAISKLQPMLDYEQDGYSGQLMLQPDSITTVEASQENYSYTISDVREYTNLDRNDTAYIPKNAEKNGVSLSLTGIDWQTMGNGTYTATASYAGRAAGSRVTGYTSQAIYTGEISKETFGGETYEVIYEGQAIPFPYVKYAIGIGMGLLALILMGILWSRRKNTKIYALLDGQFQIVRRVRVSYVDPIVDITPAAVQSRSTEYIIILDRWTAKHLHNQRLRILCADSTVKEQTIIDTGHSYKIHIEALPVPCPNEE